MEILGIGEGLHLKHDDVRLGVIRLLLRRHGIRSVLRLFQNLLNGTLGIIRRLGNAFVDGRVDKAIRESVVSVRIVQVTEEGGQRAQPD